jgi:hypothetical protein
VDKKVTTAMHQPKAKGSPFRVDESQRSHSKSDIRVSCVKMTKDSRDDALILLNTFLREDEYYLASSKIYGDRGLPALKSALNTFILRPELGFVWLAYVDDAPTIPITTQSNVNYAQAMLTLTLCCPSRT